MDGIRTPKERILAALAHIATGDTVWAATHAEDVGISCGNLYVCIEFYGLQGEYKKAQEECEQSRIARAWKTVEDAQGARDEEGSPTPQGVKAALAVMYSKGQLVDSRRIQMEHSGSVNVSGLVELFAEAKKLLEAKPDGG